MEEQNGVDRQAAMSRLKGPAIGLLVVGALGALLSVGSILGIGGASTTAIMKPFADMIENQADEAATPEEAEQLREQAEQMRNPVGSTGSSIFSGLLSLAICGLVIFGAMKMMKAESFGLSMAGAILAMIPCLSPCCCLGIPLGIWALMVMNKAEVKEAFA
ncbi:MAG: hypothetical protein V3W41_09210 [Planctomycetota bacterium]